jgi:polysaccharide pyruvyl transferase WcaK-like protein
MKKILFAGYYGYENMGDDAFGLISIWGGKRFWKCNTLSLLSNKGPIINNISIKYELPEKQNYKGQYLLYIFFKILKSDILILSGGSILGHKPKFATVGWLYYAMLRIKLSRMGAIGVSIGPFKKQSDYLFVQEQLKKFKFLVLRDVKSYQLALSMQLPYKPVLASDLAFLLADMYPNKILKKTNKKKIIGISLCHYERYVNGDISNEERREKAIENGLLEILNISDIQFHFFIINGNDKIGDKEITKTMIRKLSLKSSQYKIIDYSSNTINMLEKIRECDIVFTTRLHGAIFSAAMNIPSILVEYHEKCTNYLNDIIVDSEFRIGDMGIEPLELKEKLMKLLFYKKYNFYKNRNQCIEQAKKNFTEVFIKC